MSNTALGRSQVTILTNKSGGSVAQGDVVIIDTANAAAFTTTTTSAYVSGQVGVILEPNGIANNAAGLVALGGYVPVINLSGTGSIGDLVKTHTVAKQGVRHAAAQVAGDFAQVLGTSATPAAVLFGNVQLGTGSGGGSSLENLAKGIAYSLSVSPHASYPDVDLNKSDGSADFAVKGGKLNDGIRGSRTYTDGMYLGWSAASPVITYDFGAAVTVNRLIVMGLTDTGNTIYQPSAVKFEYSDDNSSWTTEVNKTSLSAGSGAHHWDFDYRLGSPSSHRYWRVTVTYQTTFVFLGEIEIWGSR